MFDQLLSRELRVHIVGLCAAKALPLKTKTKVGSILRLKLFNTGWKLLMMSYRISV